MAFHANQMVRCVDASLWKKLLDREPLQLGAVYTVLEYMSDYFGFPTVRIAELHSDLWMRASRFRPITETKTEIFTDIPADPSSERWDNRRKVKVPL